MLPERNKISINQTVPNLQTRKEPSTCRITGSSKSTNDRRYLVIKGKRTTTTTTTT